MKNQPSLKRKETRREHIETSIECTANEFEAIANHISDPISVIECTDFFCDFFGEFTENFLWLG